MLIPSLLYGLVGKRWDCPERPRPLCSHSVTVNTLSLPLLVDVHHPGSSRGWEKMLRSSSPAWVNKWTQDPVLTHFSKWKKGWDCSSMMKDLLTTCKVLGSISSPNQIFFFKRWLSCFQVGCKSPISKCLQTQLLGSWDSCKDFIIFIDWLIDWYWELKVGSHAC